MLFVPPQGASSSGGGSGEGAAEAALRAVLLHVDADALYREALGLYELPLAFMVITQAQVRRGACGVWGIPTGGACACTGRCGGWGGACGGARVLRSVGLALEGASTRALAASPTRLCPPTFHSFAHLLPAYSLPHSLAPPQRDPAEYALELQRFADIADPRMRRHAIDMHLGRFARALEHLVAADPAAHFEEVGQGAFTLGLIGP